MPLTTRYMAALHLARNAGELAHEFFAHRHFMFGGHTSPEDYATRSVGTLRTLIRTKLAAAFPGYPVTLVRAAAHQAEAAELLPEGLHVVRLEGRG